MITNLRATHAAELTSLAKFRSFIDDACYQIGVGSDTREDLKLAVDEACANIIEHGYAGMDPGSIIVQLYADPDRVIVTITDFGQPFEPYEPDAPDAEAIMADQESGSFGLYFIYQTMDEVDYETNPDCNNLILTKRRSGI